MIEANREAGPATVAEDERPTWIVPTVRRMHAGDAELNTVGAFDGVDLS
jgi:hypothetical protein